MTRDLLSNSLDFGRLEPQKSCFSLGGSTISEKSTFSKKCGECHFSAPFWAPNSVKIGKKSVPKMSQFFESFLEAFFTILGSSRPPEGCQNGCTILRSRSLGALRGRPGALLVSLKAFSQIFDEIVSIFDDFL